MDDLPSVELHYQGTFIPEPLVYFDPKIVSITDIDLQSMSFASFVSHLEKVIDMRCKYLYFCLPSEARLSQGLQALQNECDFSEFVEAATGSKVNVYVDHDDEPIFEWIALELPEEDEAEDQDDEEDEEVIPDGERDHEEYEEVPSIRRTKMILKKEMKHFLITQGMMRLKHEIVTKAYVSGFKQFEVLQGGERYAVDLEKRECGCRSWQLSGIPCVHGMAAIASLNLNPEDFVAECFTKTAFLRAYEYSIHPLNDSSMWPRDEDQTMVLPPKRRRMPGRPCVKRKRAQSENELSGNRSTVSRAGIRQRCKICHESGHNKARCPMKPSQPVQEEPAQEEAAEDVPEQDEVDELAQDADVPEQEEGDEPAQDEEDDDPMQEPVQPRVRLRKPSQRITKNKLKKVVHQKDGKGLQEENPVFVYNTGVVLEDQEERMLIEDRTVEPVEKLYYCVPGMPLSTGIGWIEDDVDYAFWLDTGEENGEIAVYADNSGMTLDEWWDEDMNLVVSEDESGLEDDEGATEGGQSQPQGGNGNGQSQPQGGNGNGQSQPQGGNGNGQSQSQGGNVNGQSQPQGPLCPSAVDNDGNNSESDEELENYAIFNEEVHWKK
ncbi:hypothetical protein LXL04_006175 [Taraxacum kok-saghyz]